MNWGCQAKVPSSSELGGAPNLKITSLYTPSSSPSSLTSLKSPFNIPQKPISKLQMKLCRPNFLIKPTPIPPVPAPQTIEITRAFQPSQNKARSCVKSVDASEVPFQNHRIPPAPPVHSPVAPPVHSQVTPSLFANTPSSPTAYTPSSFYDTPSSLRSELGHYHPPCTPPVHYAK